MPEPLPTTEQLFAATDRVFRERHPEAPEHLDPQDPDHSRYVEVWGQIRTEICYQWTDEAFYARYAIGRRLDPNDPGDAQMVEYWLDMRDQMEGRPGRWDWTGVREITDDEGSVVDVQVPQCTGRTFKVGQEVTRPIVRHAIEEATEYAALFNEWAKYDGNEEGQETFLKTLPNAVRGKWISVAKDWLGSWLKDWAAANQAGDIARLRREYYDQFVDGFLAGIYGHMPRGSNNRLLATVASAVASEVSGLSHDQKVGVLCYLMKNSRIGEQTDLSDDSATMPESDWNNRGYENGWTMQGLNHVISALD
jgi:hypothetical protein